MGTIDLSGTWQIRHDPLSQGLTESWWRSPPADGWRDIRVPSAWQSVLGMDANGIAWYRHELDRDRANDIESMVETGRRVWVRFESVAAYARVWLNNTEVGQHLGDYVPFQFEVTDAVKAAAGPLTLTVRVDQLHAPRPSKGVVTENGHITKGFHDVLSAQHAGIWGGVSLRDARSAAVAPNGLFIDADVRANRLTITAELEGVLAQQAARFEILDPDGKAIMRGSLAPGETGSLRQATLELSTAPALWSPRSPRLYTVNLTINDDTVAQRFGFRTIDTGGSNNSQVLLNGQPIQIRGLLHWGHEPKHIAPAPPADQVRAELRAALERGFNCICLCMFYPPDSYFDLCDELGVLVWQEHPVWKSRMTPDTIAEYKRMYLNFFRRDRKHPSVVIVSGTCEHDSYDAELSKWWWEMSGREVPRVLRQVQTGFLEWTPPGQTDLYDDHVYDNNGRWVRFVEDMEARIAKLPPKPFVMGETIISNHWPDIGGLREATKGERPWWMTHGLEECGTFERSVVRRHDAATLERFKRQGDWFAKQHRKFQAEVLRTFSRCAGFVTNSIRDVPICRLGFMDDLDRWRFAPEETGPWMGDTTLLLRTPGHLRGFGAGERVPCEQGVSNFGEGAFDAGVTLRIDGGEEQSARVAAGRGELAWRGLELAIPATTTASAIHVRARSGESVVNQWTLAVLPKGERLNFTAVLRMDVLPYTEKELAPEFEERSYSSGWGLPCRTWRPLRQSPAALMPRLPTTADDGSIPHDARTILTHRLTPQLKEYIEQGGRAVLLAGPQAGGIGSSWINLWGLLPLVIESDAAPWPVGPGESDAIVAMLLHDLTAGTTRAIPVDDRKLTDHVDPIIRYVYTHDSGVPKLFDAVFSARVGRGLLVASTLDHTTPAGGWFLDRLVGYAVGARLELPERELDITPMLAG
jgi:Glycosyl hydrolases family 2, sugar binding domain/Glycosyl hydrolases family 2